MANNGRWRKSTSIRYKPASNLHHATRFAAVIGRPLNQSVTINLTQCGCEPAEASFVFRRLVSQRFSPWLRRNQGEKTTIPPTHVWVVEYASGQAAVHWAVHVPPGLIRAFRIRLPIWLASLTGTRPDGGVVHHRPIHNITGLKRYMLKGIDPVWASFFKIRAVPQGEVIGRRSGFSKNLGPAARRRAGYKARRFIAGSMPVSSPGVVAF